MGTRNCITSDCTSKQTEFDPTYYIDPDEIDIDEIDFSFFFDNLQIFIEKEFNDFYSLIDNDLRNDGIYTSMFEDEKQLGDKDYPFFSIFRIDIDSVEYENKQLFDDCIFNFGGLSSFYIGLRSCYYNGMTFDYIWEIDEDCEFSYYNSYKEYPDSFVNELVTADTENCINIFLKKIENNKDFFKEILTMIDNKIYTFQKKLSIFEDFLDENLNDIMYGLIFNDRKLPSYKEWLLLKNDDKKSDIKDLVDKLKKLMF